MFNAKIAVWRRSHKACLAGGRGAHGAGGVAGGVEPVGEGARRVEWPHSPRPFSTTVFPLHVIEFARGRFRAYNNKVTSSSNMPIDWTNITKKYAGQWVAFKADEKTVIASGKTLKAAHRQAVEKGYAKPIMSFVPKNDMTFVGS